MKIKRMRNRTTIDEVPTEFYVHVPKGCPYKNYSYFDLLKDMVTMYDWRLEFGKEYSLSEFLFTLQDIAYVKCYGKEMMELMRKEK